MTQLKMPDINSVIIAGNLTNDPVLRKTTNGTSVTNFSIVSSRKFRDNMGQLREGLCYIGIVTWYKLAEICSKNLTKNTPVIIEGELQSRGLKMDDGSVRNIVEIKADRVQFLDQRSKAEDVCDLYLESSRPKEETDITEQREFREKEQEIEEDEESENEDLGFGDLKL